MDSTVHEKDRLLRRGNTICFPAGWRKDNSLAAYSVKDTSFVYQLPPNWNGNGTAAVSVITKNGLSNKHMVKYTNHQLDVKLEADKPYLIVPATN